MDDATRSNSQPTILIVEDHRETRTFMELALTDDYTVDCATDATDALEMTEETDYDLLIIDIALRDSIDGTELAGRLRQHHGYATTPMIAMTAHQLRKDRQFYLEQGFDEFMAKPFFPEDLLDTIARLLSEKRSDQRPPRT